ncbi:MAG: ferrous iron transporter B, partial [Actinomycetota bacterium]|nr:ferrous iron transporter B [Actinomycetota bacterium]
RYEGLARIGDHSVVIEDLPGTYSLDPISPDEQVVHDALDPTSQTLQTPDALLVLMDATTLRRSLGLLAQVLARGLPTCVVLTFRDELARRGGALDVARLERALGVRVVAVSSGSRDELGALKDAIGQVATWPSPIIPPPVRTEESRGWVASVLDSAAYESAQIDARTARIDTVLLHPLWGSLIFLATMFAFFQVIFTVAAPIQNYVETQVNVFGAFVTGGIGNHWVASFLSQAIFGGVGGVLVFLPQIALLFLLISLLEGSGYLSRAAFLMDRVMAKAGLEGRAFVALLSSMACAIPGIMATRSLPSAKDRIATMMGAPLMTCSARLPVYILLVGLLVPSSARIGPVGAQGTIMFALYTGGAVAAMATAWIFKRFTGKRGPVLPFYMEMPSYRLPSLRAVGVSVWDACKMFLSKVGRIILVVTIIMWALLNIPGQSDAAMRSAGVNPGDKVAAASFVLDHSAAASVGKAIEPVFAPLGFDWRINIGVVSSLSARETFVATLGQVASAQDAEAPGDALKAMTYTDGAHQGQKLFNAGTVTALLVFFMFALQCMSTVAMMRRETGGWKWPGIAFGYMFVLAWGMAFLARLIVTAIV